MARNPIGIFDRCRSAFTLIEMVIFIAIFTMVIISFISILVSTLTVQTNQSAANEVNQQSQYLIQQIQYYTSSARLIDTPQDVATSTLQLREVYSDIDPTTIAVASGTVNLQQGVGTALQPITSNKVFVSQLSFVRHYQLSTSSAYGTDSISYSFTMTATSTNNKQYSGTFQSAAAVLAPVPKIALIQKAQHGTSLVSATQTATFATNNETGSLLIAFVPTYSATSPASTSVSDSAGNVWTLIASSSYPAYQTTMTIFDALNVKNSSNTVTARFGVQPDYAAVLVYEYRGASTSSSFDASSSQTQASMAVPSSGMANPTSTSELLFGVSSNAETGEVPSPSNGFTFEASDSINTFNVEDMNQFVTGPVAATWIYTSAIDTSDMIVTFK